MARPPYSPVQEKVFWHPLWNSILDNQLKSGCSVRKKKTDNNQKGWTLRLYAVASIKLNNNDKKKKWLHCVPTLTLLLLLYSLLDYPLNSPMAGSYHFEISERGTKGAQLIAPKIIIKRQRETSLKALRKWTLISHDIIPPPQNEQQNNGNNKVVSTDVRQQPLYLSISVCVWILSF